MQKAKIQKNLCITCKKHKHYIMYDCRISERYGKCDMYEPSNLTDLQKTKLFLKELKIKYKICILKDFVQMYSVDTSTVHCDFVAYFFKNGSFLTKKPFNKKK